LARPLDATVNEYILRRNIDVVGVLGGRRRDGVERGVGKRKCSLLYRILGSLLDNAGIVDRQLLNIR